MGKKRPRDDNDDNADDATPRNALHHAFSTEEDDHAETPGAAYDDISYALDWIAKRLSKPKDQLAIWDPYFCAGAVVQNLKARGFPKVHNVNEDAYERMKDPPLYDVLVTNPPYSGDHIERLLSFCVASRKPWFLLLPNFVYVNSYFAAQLGEKVKPFYLCPRTRYEYIVPAKIRREEHTVKTAPFLSFWYVSLQAQENAPFIRDWRACEKAAAAAPEGRERQRWDGPPIDAVDLVGRTSQLPHRLRARYDPTRRRLRKKQREAGVRKLRRKRQEAARAKKPCKFGAACEREGCWFWHPAKKKCLPASTKPT